MSVLGVKPAVFGLMSPFATRVADDAGSNLLLSSKSVVVVITPVVVVVTVLVIG